MPIIFLAGPPGSGKSTLGRRACDALGLRFLDIATSDSLPDILEEVIRQRTADVVALPWQPDEDRRTFAACRRAGTLLALWAHPLDMQARSGRAERLFTPVGRLKTRGGFGRSGIACREFRHLSRACDYVLDLVDLSEAESLAALRSAIEDLRQPASNDPVEQAELQSWVGHWRQDCNADPEACRLLVEAMARFILQLQSQGASPRKMSGVRSDLHVAGMLVMCYDAPRGKKVFDSFHGPPLCYEFRRKISDSPNLQARYKKTLTAFAEFLRATGVIAPE